jgi:putative transposase
MVKIKNKKRLKWALEHYKNEKGTQQEVAGFLQITPRRFRQLHTAYIKTGILPDLGKNLGRPKQPILPEHKAIILEKHAKYQSNALYLEKVIYAENQIRIPHNTIHKMLLEQGLAQEEPAKKKRRKKWIRYEREHSLSAVHLDWHEPSGGPKVCVVEDDASRKILAGGEFEHATVENTILLMKHVIEKYGHIRVVRESITDHGCQFYANKRDKEGEADHAYEQFLAEQGIRQILCRYKHPQSNGKIERWFGTYEKHRKRFKTFEEFVEWYNNRPHGSLNLRRAETPEIAFWRKLPEEYFYRLAVQFLEW